MIQYTHSYFIFFFNDTATTEIYTLSLHDALPISHAQAMSRQQLVYAGQRGLVPGEIAEHQIAKKIGAIDRDRKSTRLNSSHLGISYAVFCLKKKKKTRKIKIIQKKLI